MTESGRGESLYQSHTYGNLHVEVFAKDFNLKPEVQFEVGGRV